ncbi:glycosyltransferase family 39 protein [Alphaproteobacteria bacterium]|nr:glycosyltransferase family 39 protein [Alphaproteobacteria bacterium]
MALVVRLINLAICDFSPDAMLLEDAAHYWTTITTDQTFLDNAHFKIFSQTERMPGYFLFLAATVRIFGENFLPVLVLQSVIDSLTCVLIGALGCYVYPKHYGVFGWLAAVWPNLFIHSGQILGDSLFVFFFVWFLLSFTRFLNKPKILAAVVTGTALGLATLVRPTTQFIIFLTPVLLPLILIISKMKVREAVFNSLVVFAVSVVCVAPVIIKNHNKYDSFALTSQNGTHLQNWVTSEVVMLRDGVRREEAVKLLQTKTNKALAALSPSQQINPFVRSAQQVDTALVEMVATPTQIIVKSWLQGAVINLAAPALMIDKRVRQLPHISFAGDTRGDLFARTWQFISGSSSIYVAALFASAAVAIIISLIQFAGFFVQARVNMMLAVLSALTVAYFIIINGPVGSPKYRLPIEPILIIWFGCGLLSCWKFVKNFRYRRAIS